MVEMWLFIHAASTLGCQPRTQSARHLLVRAHRAKRPATLQSTTMDKHPLKIDLLTITNSQEFERLDGKIQDKSSNPPYISLYIYLA